MSSFIARRFLAALLLLMSLSLGARAGLAQQPEQVTVALVDHLADSAVATLVARPGAERRMLILLRERDADEIALASAMMAAFEARRVLGDTVHSRLIVPVYGRRRAGSLSPNERRLAARYVAQLRAAKPEPLDGVGFARTVQVAMAPVRGTGRRLR